MGGLHYAKELHTQKQIHSCGWIGSDKPGSWRPSTSFVISVYFVEGNSAALQIDVASVCCLSPL
jgi:hypothetical protein